MKTRLKCRLQLSVIPQVVAEISYTASRVRNAELVGNLKATKQCTFGNTNKPIKESEEVKKMFTNLSQRIKDVDRKISNLDDDYIDLISDLEKVEELAEEAESIMDDLKDDLQDVYNSYDIMDEVD